MTGLRWTMPLTASCTLLIGAPGQAQSPYFSSQITRLEELGAMTDAVAVAEEIVRLRPDEVKPHEFLAREYILHPDSEQRLSYLTLSIPGGTLNENSINYASEGRATPHFEEAQTNRTREHARQHLRALTRLAEEGGSTMGNTTAYFARNAILDMLYDSTEADLRGEAARALGASRLGDRADILLRAFDYEETTFSAKALPQIIQALGSSDSPAAFTRLLGLYEALTSTPVTAPRPEVPKLPELLYSALLRLPSPASTDELVADLRSPEEWRQALAAHQLIRRPANGSGQSGPVRLLAEILRPAPFPTSAWEAATLNLVPRTPEELNLLREALGSGEPRLTARAVFLAQRVPLESRAPLQETVLSLLASMAADAPFRRSTEELLIAPETTGAMQVLSEYVLLKTISPSAEDSKARRSGRSTESSAPKKAIEALAQVTSEPLRQVFVAVLDNATSAGAPEPASLEAIQRGAQVVAAWGPGAASRVLLGAAGRHVTSGKDSVSQAAEALRGVPLSREELATVLGWLGKPAELRDLDSSPRFRAVQTVLYQNELQAQEWALESLHSGNLLWNVLAAGILQRMSDREPGRFPAGAEAAVETVFRDLQEEITRQKQAGITPGRSLQNASEAYERILKDLRGTSGPGGNWFLR